MVPLGDPTQLPDLLGENLGSRACGYCSTGIGFPLGVPVPSPVGCLLYLSVPLAPLTTYWVSTRRSPVRERLIGALIPDALGPREEIRPVPLPVLPPLHRLGHVRPTELLVATRRTDSSGRIQERALLGELGWEPGDRMEMDTLHGMIVIAAHPLACT